MFAIVGQLIVYPVKLYLYRISGLTPLNTAKKFNRIYLTGVKY